MYLDYLVFYVEDAVKWKNWFVKVMGFDWFASGYDQHTQIEVVTSGDWRVAYSRNTFTPSISVGHKHYRAAPQPIKFILASPKTCQSPAALYLNLHPPGVGDVAFRVDSLAAQLQQMRAVGVETDTVQQQQYSQGKLRWTKVVSQAGITHTLIQREGTTPLVPYYQLQIQPITPPPSPFKNIDHIVINVANGTLASTVTWYEQALGFKPQQNFTINTELSALASQVLVHPTSGVQLPVNQPLSSNSQIQEFLDFNGGAGIQHIALQTDQIINTTKKLRQAGLPFLDIPNCYYSELQQQLEVKLHSDEWQQIIQQSILIDSQFSENNLPNLKFNQPQLKPLLLQIFTQPIFDRPTFFFEIIERRQQAKGFGEGNFMALFQAIEQEQIKRGTLY